MLKTHMLGFCSVNVKKVNVHPGTGLDVLVGDRGIFKLFH
jgi:hypothetical protein